MSQTGSRAGACRFQAGFTLVELMVTIFVAAILIAIAVPSFKSVTTSSRLTTTANSLVSALHAARMEAIKRNADVQFCGAVDGSSGDLATACGTGQPGAVYALVGVASAASAVQVQAAPVVSAASLHMKQVNAITFSAQGLGQKAGDAQPYTGTVAIVCSTAISSNNMRVVKMTTGSILATNKSTGTCP
jgi:type IV fimbrial biogenesis protein FimT